MQILTEMFFTLDYAQFEEKRIYHYIEDDNPEYLELQNDFYKTFPYGTLFLELVEVDQSIFDKIISSLFTSRSTDKEDMQSLALNAKPLFENLPEVFCIYKEKGLRTFEAILDENKWKNSEMVKRMFKGVAQMRFDARDILSYTEQLKILLNAKVFSDKIYEQKSNAAMRMDMIYELLGTRDKNTNDEWNAPRPQHDTEMTSGIVAKVPLNIFNITDYSFLYDAEIRQRLVISAKDDMHRFDFYNIVDNTMQNSIMAYIKDMIEQSVIIRKCKHCGRYFVAQGKTIYCDRTVDENGNTCRQIGAMARYAQNLDSAPEKKAYRQVYKNNFAKMKKGVLSESEFEQWKKEAKALKKDVENGMVQTEAFLDWLKYGE